MHWCHGMPSCFAFDARITRAAHAATDAFCDNSIGGHGMDECHGDLRLSWRPYVVYVSMTNLKPLMGRQSLSCVKQSQSSMHRSWTAAWLSCAGHLLRCRFFTSSTAYSGMPVNWIISLQGDE
jgi:hypothetical protein